MNFRRGVRLALDVGEKRIGVARSDQDGTLVIPLETVSRSRRGEDITRIKSLVYERGAIEIVVGLPNHLKGVEGKSAHMARKFAMRLVKTLPDVRICMVDERLSSAQAHLRLTQAGLDSRQQREVIDQVAAQIILEQALAIERNTGAPPGQSPEYHEVDERNTGE